MWQCRDTIIKKFKWRCDWGTFPLAVYLMDRYISEIEGKIQSRNHFHAIAIASLIMASDIKDPDIISISVEKYDNNVDPSAVEIIMGEMKANDFILATFVTPYDLMMEFLEKMGFRDDECVNRIAKLLLGITISNAHLIANLPSTIAGACIYGALIKCYYNDLIDLTIQSLISLITPTNEGSLKSLIENIYTLINELVLKPDHKYVDEKKRYWYTHDTTFIRRFRGK